MINKKFSLMYVLNLVVITTLVLAACSKASPTVTPEQVTQAPSTALPTSAPAALATSSSANPTTPAYWPTQDWRTSTPEQQGMDPAQISKMFDAINNNYPWIHSVLIVRNGYLVTEAYYSPFRPDAGKNIITVTESVVSILIGAAIQEGFIKGVEQKMLDFFPDRKIAFLNARKQVITIKDLLTMTSGFFNDGGNGDESDDWVQAQLDLPMADDPGTVYAPSRGGYILLCAIIQKATGMTALAFANKYLFGPLGITGAQWETDPHGIENGGNRLYLTSRDMAKIGFLYLNNGAWNGKQIVSKEYVLASTKHLFDIPSSGGWGYGFGWWIAPHGGYSTERDAGQLISVKPEQGIVTVFTGSASGDLSLEEDVFVDNIIVPAVKSAAAPLSENQASMAVLKDKITALEKPVPQSIPPLPTVAQTISGNKYLLNDGEAFTLTFAGDQATLDWSLKDQSMHLQIGMDNVFRITAVDQTERLAPFGAQLKTLNPGYVALLGSWSGNGVFSLTMQFLNSVRRHTVRFTFTEDKVNIIQTNVNGSELVTVSFEGQAERLPSSTTTTPAPSWIYVAFGDSWPYGAHCNGCRPFPALYADGLEATTARKINYINLTTNGGTSQSLLESIQTSQKTRDAIMSADIILIATGGNDLEPAFNAYVAGTCGGADKLDCFRKVAEILRASFDGIVTEIEALRNGRPTAIRLVTTSNEFLSDLGLIQMFGAEFGKTGGVAITQMNRDVQCEIAAKHNAKCVDLGLALNGPDLLRPQDVNTQEAMQAVADALVASGLDELR